MLASIFVKVYGILIVFLLFLVIILSLIIVPLDVLVSSIQGLFEGVCHFQPSYGVQEQVVYNFEDGETTEEGVWVSWNGYQAPERTREEVLCGYQSLYVSTTILG